MLIVSANVRYSDIGGSELLPCNLIPKPYIARRKTLL
jgi:hypothetical protein